MARRTAQVRGVRTPRISSIRSAAIQNVKTVPNVPVVAKGSAGSVVSESADRWPIVAEAGRRTAKGGRTRRKPRQVQKALAAKGLVRPPPSKAGKKKRKRKAGKSAPSRRKSRRRAGMPDFIQRMPVVSSNVASIGYDETSMILEVEFKSGSVYRYFDIDESTWGDFLSAPSKGRFVWRRLRGYGSDDVYVYSRVN